jgi:mycothiol synthase
MFRLRRKTSRLLRAFLPEARVRGVKRCGERIVGPEHLHMVRAGLEDLPVVRLPAGYHWKETAQGLREEYLFVMHRSLVAGADDDWFRKVFSQDPEYDPADLFIVRREERPVGAAAAWRLAWEDRTAGTVHMVGVDPDCRGEGLGRALVVAVLHRLRQKGFREAHLLTEDFRTAALSLYLSLGFRPVMVHWTHRLRWRRALGRVGQARREAATPH